MKMTNFEKAKLWIECLKLAYEITDYQPYQVASALAEQIYKDAIKNSL